MAEEAFMKVPLRPKIFDRSNVHVVCGSGEELTVLV